MNQQELKTKAILYNGGLSKLIPLFDKEGVFYELGKSGETAILKIKTNEGTIAAYDRKQSKVRIGIPKRHLLAKKYSSIGGYLTNKSNTNTENVSYIQVYFDNDDFDKLIPYLK